MSHLSKKTFYYSLLLMNDEEIPKLNMKFSISGKGLGIDSVSSTKYYLAYNSSMTINIDEENKGSKIDLYKIVAEKIFEDFELRRPNDYSDRGIMSGDIIIVNDIPLVTLGIGFKPITLLYDKRILSNEIGKVKIINADN